MECGTQVAVLLLRYALLLYIWYFPDSCFYVRQHVIDGRLARGRMYPYPFSISFGYCNYKPFVDAVGYPQVRFVASGCRRRGSNRLDGQPTGTAVVDVEIKPTSIGFRVASVL